MKPSSRVLFISMVLGGVAVTTNCNCGAAEAPGIPTVSPLPSVVNDNPVRISGSKTAASQVLVQSEHWSDAREAGPIDESTSWSYELELEEGVNRFVVIGRNEDGVLSDASEQVMVTYDSIAPNAPELNAFEKDVEIPTGETSVEVVLSGTKDSDSDLRVNDEIIVDLTENTRTWSYTATVELGDQTFSFTSVDVGGNTSAAVEVVLTGVIDNDAPEAPTVDAYEETVSLVEGETVRPVSLSGGKEAACTLAVDDQQVSGTYGFPTWEIMVNLTQGNNVFALTCVDTAENTSAATTVEIYAVPFLSPPELTDFPEVTNEDPLTLTGTKPVETGIELQWDGETEWTTILEADSEDAALGTFSYTGVDLSEGANSFYLRSVTVGGDASASSELFSVELDTDAPEAPVVTTVVPPTFFFSPGDDTGTLTLDGTKVDGTTLVINGEPVDDSAEGTEWSATVDLALGANTVTVAVQDAAGNLSEVLTFDVTGAPGLSEPTINLPEGPVSAADLGAGGQYEFTGTRPAGSTLYWFLEGDDPVVVFSGAGETFAFSLTLVEGENTFFIYAADDAGARSNDVGPNSVVLDTEAPEPPLVDQPDPSTVSDEIITITGSKATQDTTVCLQQGGTECILVWAYSAPLPFEVSVQLLEGFNTLCFRSADLAGNLSDCAGGEDGFVVERTRAPQVAFVKPETDAIIDTNQIEVRVEAWDERDGCEADQISPRPCIDSVEVCIVDDCVDAVGGGGIYTWIATIELDAPIDGTIYTVTAHATSDLGQVGTGDVILLYAEDPVVVSDRLDSDEWSVNARGAVDQDGRLHLVWEDYCWDSLDCDVGSETFGPDIFYVSFDGQSWGEVYNLSAITGEANSYAPDVAVDSSGTIHIVWHDDGNVLAEGEDFDVIHRMVSPITLQPLPGASVVTTGSSLPDRFARIGTDDFGKLHAVWQRGACDDLETCIRDIWYANWTGGTWNIPILVTYDANGGDSSSPSIAVSPQGEAYIAWVDEPKGNSGTALDNSGIDKDVFMKAYDQQFGDTVKLSDDLTDSTQVSIAYEEPRDENDLPEIHAVWREENESQSNILYRGYTPFTSAFTETSQLSSTADETAFVSQTPHIATDWTSETVYVAWSENSSGRHRVHHTMRPFGGMFGEGEIISDDDASGWSIAPYLVVDPGLHLFLIRQDEREISDSGSDFDIFVGMHPTWY